MYKRCLHTWTGSKSWPKVGSLGLWRTYCSIWREGKEDKWGESGVRSQECGENQHWTLLLCLINSCSETSRPSSHSLWSGKKDGKNHQKEIERIKICYKSIFRRRRKNWFYILTFALSWFSHIVGSDWDIPTYASVIWQCSILISLPA